MNRTLKIVLLYIAVTFSITWLITIACYLLFKFNIISLNQLNLLFNLGALGPFLGALISTRAFYGKKTVGTLLRSFRLKNISTFSILFALSPLLILAIALLIYPLLSGNSYTFEITREQFHLDSVTSYFAWSLPFIFYAFFEEFGWRGFLLPYLQKKYTALAATAILSVIWATWHLPFFLWRFDFSFTIAIGFFFSMFVGSVLLTFLFNTSNGNIAPVIVFHLANNIASALDKQYIVATIGTTFCLMAIFIVYKYKSLNFSLKNKEKILYSAGT
jgi:membrane protease YdiL (CAAX protease family)